MDANNVLNRALTLLQSNNTEESIAQCEKWLDGLRKQPPQTPAVGTTPITPRSGPSNVAHKGSVSKELSLGPSPVGLTPSVSNGAGTPRGRPSNAFVANKRPREGSSHDEEGKPSKKLKDTSKDGEI